MHALLGTIHKPRGVPLIVFYLLGRGRFDRRRRVQVGRRVASTTAQGIAAVAHTGADAATDKLSQADILRNDIKQQAQKLLRQTGEPAL